MLEKNPKKITAGTTAVRVQARVRPHPGVRADRPGGPRGGGGAAGPTGLTPVPPRGQPGPPPGSRAGPDPGSGPVGPLPPAGSTPGLIPVGARGQPQPQSRDFAKCRKLRNRKIDSADGKIGFF